MAENIELVQISSDRWEEYKAIRLKALADNPYSFDASPDEELGLTDEEWKDRLSDPNAFRVFAQVDGKLVAKVEVDWKSSRKISHVAEVYGVYIDPEYRGQRLGGKLMTEIETLAKAHGIRKLWLDVVTTQEPAMSLYRSAGFREVGRLEQATYVNGQYYDKLLMEKLI
ncbi:MAG: GNAT family N-acetyltransferase [Candidatus Daviesbacteria bacterium]|nr:GNAT family N-acetyltransferase [Candidatus Daviesbacteria bacterium]